MKQDDFFCPMPMKWNEIYTSLLKIWEQMGKDPKEKPPVPLILAAWHETPNLAKLLRWKDTVAWAESHNCSHLVLGLKEEEKFRAEKR